MGTEKGQRDRHIGHIIPELAKGFSVLSWILVEGRNNYTVPMLPEVLLVGDR